MDTSFSTIATEALRILRTFPQEAQIITHLEETDWMIEGTQCGIICTHPEAIGAFTLAQAMKEQCQRDGGVSCIQ